MENKTTIQLSDATKAELDALKDGDTESYDHALQRIIAHYKENSEQADESRMRTIADEQISERVIPEAQR